MNPLLNTQEVEAATRTLGLLNQQAEDVRTELEGLRQDLTAARRDLSEVRQVELREANEHLVLAVLQAETIAENAATHVSELTLASQRDALTKIPNRALMLDRLDNAMAAARRHGTRLAVLFLDLDDFKEINDTLGHVAGDEVLQQTASHLQSVVRDSDTVSRYGGDEFLVLLADVTHAADAALVAAKILSALADSIRVADHVLRLSASIGIAIYPEDADDAVTLIGRADAAMYHSKRSRRSSFKFYSDTIQTEPNPAPATAELPRPMTRGDLAMAAHDMHLHHLREANEQLVLAALSAQELEARAKEEHSRQTAFLAMVAHELRGPLTPIQTAAELISRVHGDEPLLERLQSMIKRQVAHMARLADDLIDGSCVSTGKFRLQLSAVDMSEVLNQAVDTCRPAMDVRLQQLKVKLPHSPIRVYGDPMRLAQIFSNLLANASKYTPHGGEITLTAKAREDSIEITVADKGIGISAEVLPHIFELFVQDVHAMTPHNYGLGIGLAVVHDLVELHGGTVVATSAGRHLGSQFVVTLPMSEE